MLQNVRNVQFLGNNFLLPTSLYAAGYTRPLPSFELSLTRVTSLATPESYYTTISRNAKQRQRVAGGFI